MRLFTICLVIASCTIALSAATYHNSSATPSPSETPSQLFAAQAAVKKSVSKLVAHADAALKKCNQSNLAATFPSDAATLRPVKIFNDLPVVLGVDFLKTGRILLYRRYGRRL
jgi:hypothetical protein